VCTESDQKLQENERLLGNKMDRTETIWIIDPDAENNEELKLYFHTNAMPVVTFTSAERFLDTTHNRQIGCIICESKLPGMTGLELQQEMQKRQSNIPIVFITKYASISESVSAIKAGAVDYIEKPVKLSYLNKKVVEALKQSRDFYEQMASVQAIKSKFASLSQRERDVLELLVSGSVGTSNKDIAQFLHISHRTVEHHRAKIMKKTMAKSLAELLSMVTSYRSNSKSQKF